MTLPRFLVYLPTFDGQPKPQFVFDATKGGTPELPRDQAATNPQWVALDAETARLSLTEASEWHPWREGV